MRVCAGEDRLAPSQLVSEVLNLDEIMVIHMQVSGVDDPSLSITPMGGVVGAPIPNPTGSTASDSIAESAPHRSASAVGHESGARSASSISGSSSGSSFSGYRDRPVPASFAICKFVAGRNNVYDSALPQRIKDAFAEVNNGAKNFMYETRWAAQSAAVGVVVCVRGVYSCTGPSVLAEARKIFGALGAPVEPYEVRSLSQDFQHDDPGDRR
jgi:hypothetical protein